MMKTLTKVLIIVVVGANVLIFYYNLKFAKEADVQQQTAQAAEEKPQESSSKPEAHQPVSESTIPTDKIIIPFSSGLKLSPQSQEALSKLFNTMSGNPKLKVKVTGYADSQGNPFNNLQLSAKRAAVVQGFLVSLGIARERIIVQGEGSKDPIADNSTEDGRAQNRRVEVTIING